MLPIKVRTVDTKYYSIWDDDIDIPGRYPVYRRIVAIVKDGELVWAEIPPDELRKYNPDDSVADTIELPELYAERLYTFYDRYFGPEPKMQRGEQYTCHRFAYWMGGIAIAKSYGCPPAPDHYVQDGVKINLDQASQLSQPGHLRPGEHGVIGTQIGDTRRAPWDRRASAWHSIIGLGHHTPDCLQVSGNGGFLGITTYEDAMNKYETASKIEGLFVRGF